MDQARNSLTRAREYGAFMSEEEQTVLDYCLLRVQLEKDEVGIQKKFYAIQDESRIIGPEPAFDFVNHEDPKVRVIRNDPDPKYYSDLADKYGSSIIKTQWKKAITL